MFVGKTYQLEGKEIEYLKKLQARIDELKQEAALIQRSFFAALELICAQRGLEGRYNLNDDWLLEPIEEKNEERENPGPVLVS